MTKTPARRIAWILAAAIALSPVMLSSASSAPADLSHAGGSIVFTFAGGWASGVHAAQILDTHGMKGTFYVSSGLLRAGSWYTSYMSAEDVATLASRGHDIESMTVTQRDLTTLGPSERTAELVDSQRQLQSITGKQVRHLAYPYGAVDDAVAAAAAGNYASGQTISWTIEDFGGSVDAYRLPGFLMRQSTSLAEAKWIVDQAIARDVSVVLTFGRIVTDPGPYDWTPANLEALASYVASKGVDTQTISQLVSGTPPPPTPPPPAGSGTIVFTFDDGSTSHVAAGQILAERGFRGTFYIVSECMKSEANQEMCMTSQQVRALSDAGHDIGSHTVRHRDLTRLSSSALTTELSKSKSALETMTGRPVESIAYPYGAHNAAVRARADDYYASGRIYLNDPAPSDLPVLLAQSGDDPMLVPGIGVVQATSLARAKAYVDHAVANNVTIVLVFHDITSPPIDEFAWTPADLAALADHVKAKGATVQTMAQRY